MATDTKKKVRVAVIGVGNMGRHHVRNYSQIEEAELVGLADVNPEAKKLAQEYKTKYFADYKKLLDEMSPMAVSVAVPTPLHYEIGKEVMRRGIHCLMEKPIAYSVKEADALIGLAEQYGLIFTVGHIERFNPIVKKIKEVIESKKLGKITSIICQRVGGFPKAEPKTDVIIDLAVHDIDIINYLLGRIPDKVYGHGSQTLHTKAIDSAEILLDYGNAAGFVQANWLTPVKIRTISITGSEGYISGNYITQELIFYKHNIEKNAHKVGNFANFVTKMGEPEKVTIAVDFKEPLAVELKAFLSAVSGNVQAGLVNPWDAREALRISLATLATENVKG